MTVSNSNSRISQNGGQAQAQPSYADLVSPAVAAASVGIQSNIKRTAEKRTSEQAPATGGVK